MKPVVRCESRCPIEREARCSLEAGHVGDHVTLDFPNRYLWDDENRVATSGHNGGGAKPEYNAGALALGAAVEAMIGSGLDAGEATMLIVGMGARLAKMVGYPREEFQALAMRLFDRVKADRP